MRLDHGVTFAAYGTVILISTSLMSVVVRCIIMNVKPSTPFSEWEACDHCENMYKMDDMEFVGGAWFCDPCMEELEAMPAPNQRDLELMDEEHRRAGYEGI